MTRILDYDMLSFNHFPLNDLIYIVTHLKLCSATASHNFQWVKITHICLIWNQIFVKRYV